MSWINKLKGLGATFVVVLLTFSMVALFAPSAQAEDPTPSPDATVKADDTSAKPEVKESSVPVAEETEAPAKTEVKESSTPVVKAPKSKVNDFDSRVEKVRWLVPQSVGNPNGKTVDASFFPQPRLTGALQCGRWSQNDEYPIDSKADDEVFKSLGDTLEWLNGKAEDYKIYGSHTFTYGGDCPPPLTPKVTLDYSKVCGAITLTTLNNGSVPATWYYGLQGKVDGVRVVSAVQKGPGTKTSTKVFAEDYNGGSVDVEVSVYAATEQDLLPKEWPYGKTVTVTVDTDCEPNLVEKVATAPSSQDKCEPVEGTDDSVTIPADEFFVFKLDGVDKAAGTYLVTGTSTTVTAHAKDGFTPKPDSKTSWTFEFTKVACVVPPVETTVTAPAFTKSTCTKLGTVEVTDTKFYTWNITGPNSAKVYTAVLWSELDNVTLVGQTSWTFDLTKKTGEKCDSAPSEDDGDQPLVPAVTPPQPINNWSAALGIIALVALVSAAGLLVFRRQQ